MDSSKQLIRFKKLSPDAIIPKEAKPGDAGLDLSTISDNELLMPGQRSLIPTGIAMSIPPGYVGLVCPRSGLANQYGITIVNAPGIIDSEYRGEIKVILLNTGNKRVSFKKGDRIAQLVVVKCEGIQAIEVDTLDETVRGTGGFGSSGV